MIRSFALPGTGIRMAFASALALSGAPVLAAGVDAGTRIENRASATFETPQGSQTAQSNAVALRVDELLDASVASLDPGPVTATTGSVVLAFTLTNNGNGPERFRLIAEPGVAGNSFDLAIDGIATDANANGVYDEGTDPLLTAPQVSSEIAADGAATVFVIASVPAGTVDGARSRIELQASAITGSGVAGNVIPGAGTDGSDAVVGANGAQAFGQGEVVTGSQSVVLSKSATISDPFGGSSAVPGATISYSIAVAVSGSGAVDNLTVTDSVPAGTAYVAGSLSLDNTPLSDASGDDAGQANASGISIALGTVAAGTSSTIRFNVRIEE